MTHELLPSTARLLEHRVATLQATGRAPSVAAGVVRDGALVWVGGRGRLAGPAPAEVGYRVGSITKTFTAVLLLQLRDEGRLRLTDPLSAHLPEVDVPQTLAQLLSHTSGVTSEPPGTWFERVPGAGFADLAAALRDEPARVTPGSRLHYSNVGFGLLGEVVARLRGVPWDEALRQHVLEPLGLARTTTTAVRPHATGWAVHPYADVLLREPPADIGAMAPAGQLWSTLRDLGRWLGFLAGDGTALLAAGTLPQMRQPATVEDGPRWASGYGLGLQLRRLDGRRLVGHGGSMPGFLAAAWADQDTGDGAVVLADATAGVDVTGTALDLLGLLAEHEPPLPAPWAPAEVDPALLELTGPWFWGPAPFTLSVHGRDELRLCGAGGGRAAAFRTEGPDIWTGLDGYYAGERLRVVRTADGRPSHLDLATFVFTRRPYGPADSVPGGLDPRGWHTPDAPGGPGPGGD